MDLPKIEPVKLVARKEPFTNPDFIFELKYDGYRCLVYIEKGECRLISRHGKEFSGFQNLQTALSELKVRSAILDGELVVIDEHGKPRLEKLIKREGEIMYVVWDIMWLNGEDLRKKPLLERKEVLKRILPESSHIQFAKHILEQGEQCFPLVQKLNLEGMVAKRKDSLYVPGARWMKIKNPAYRRGIEVDRLFRKKK